MRRAREAGVHHPGLPRNSPPAHRNSRTAPLTPHCPVHSWAHCRPGSRPVPSRSRRPRVCRPPLPADGRQPVVHRVVHRELWTTCGHSVHIDDQCRSRCGQTVDNFGRESQVTLVNAGQSDDNLWSAWKCRVDNCFLTCATAGRTVSVYIDAGRICAYYAHAIQPVVRTLSTTVPEVGHLTGKPAEKRPETPHGPVPADGRKGPCGVLLSEVCSSDRLAGFTAVDGAGCLGRHTPGVWAGAVVGVTEHCQRSARKAVDGATPVTWRRP